MKHSFKAKIYKTGINWAVDVPSSITKKLIVEKGYIRIKGNINRFEFKQTLVPVKNSLYRLYVNLIMMKGGKTAVGQTVSFIIEQNLEKIENQYPMNGVLLNHLKEHRLVENFNALTATRKKNILKYLSYIKTEETLLRNVSKLIQQLRSREKKVQIP